MFCEIRGIKGYNSVLWDKKKNKFILWEEFYGVKQSTEKMHKRKCNEVKVLKIVIRAYKKKCDNFILLFELLVF